MLKSSLDNLARPCLKNSNKNLFWEARWWCTPSVPVLGKQRKVDFCEFKARVSSRKARALLYNRNLVSKTRICSGDKHD